MRTIKVKCPYCGMENKVEVNELYDDAKIVFCDILRGGCEKMFVADISVAINAQTRKVEGQ